MGPTPSRAIPNELMKGATTGRDPGAYAVRLSAIP